MKIFPRKKNSGFAVIVALIAITVLSIMAAGFALSMRVETTLAANANSDEQLLWAGRSEVEKARWILAEEASIPGEPYDSLNQFWSSGSCSLGESNSPLAGVTMVGDKFGDAVVTKFAIIDLERKININTANAEILQQVLTAMGADADSLSIVSDSIQDWIDPDENPRIAGAESDYYQSLTPPYYAKDAPIDDLSELLFVKGVTREMYLGGSATNSAGAAFQHHLGLGTAPGETPNYAFGLADVFTPVSSGRINVNTADTNVLQLIPGVDADTAANIVKFRAGPDGVEGNDDDTPFQNVNQIVAAGVPAQAAQQLAQFCTVRSSTFEVTITVAVGQHTRDFHAILLRNSGADIQVVGFYWK